MRRIELIQTKIHASVTIRIAENEKFDPKKFHFLLLLSDKTF